VLAGPDDAELPGADSESDESTEPQPQAAEPDAPVEPEPEEAAPSEPYVVVRWTGSGPFAGTIGGVKVRQRIMGGGTMSVPERCLDEARGKGCEFVRAAN
jgi:hypothetical protein